MKNKTTQTAVRLDALALFLAGLINSVLALFVAGVVFAPGTRAAQADLLLRADWIANHTFRWQAGWLFWFAVTLSFAWSYFALGRHLETAVCWPSLAVGVALIAAAVDIVGVLINIAAIPQLAGALAVAADPTLQIIFQATESATYALINVAAFGLYTVAGLLLLPATFNTAGYPRPLFWLGAAEWGIAAVATLLLLIAPALATVPLLISFVLYAPWVWGGAIWILRNNETGN